MKSLPFSNIRFFVIITSLLILSGGIGYRLGEKHALPITPISREVINREIQASPTVDFSLFWDVWQRMFRYYIDANSLDAQKMVWGAISGMVASAGDPYTAFYPPKENKEFKDDLGGEFQGIGAQLGTKDNHIVVIAPLKGTPAEKAGIKPGDWIVKVNDEETFGWTVPQAVSKIRGPGGTTVTLTILHDNATKPVDIAIVRDVITVPSVESWIKPVSEITELKESTSSSKLLERRERVALLRLSRFGDHSNEDWIRAVDEIVAERKKGGVKGLILDLRNNPGGYLEGSVFIASEFLRSGIVVSQVNSDGSKQEYKVNRQGKLLDIPVVVLINKGSASASEIVAGSLRDYKRATIVGETSYGKGSVQTPQDLPGGSSVHITTGKWITPKGEWISKKGIVPDVMVALDDNRPSFDTQLEKAVELLLK